MRKPPHLPAALIAFWGGIQIKNETRILLLQGLVKVTSLAGPRWKMGFLTSHAMLRACFEGWDERVGSVTYPLLPLSITRLHRGKGAWGRWFISRNLPDRSGVVSQVGEGMALDRSLSASAQFQASSDFSYILAEKGHGVLRDPGNDAARFRMSPSWERVYCRHLLCQ